MEYEFRNDPTTGLAKAQFSFEQEMLGPWLEVEVADNSEVLSALLLAITQIEQGEKQEILITGKEYSLSLSAGDAVVQPNIMFNGTAMNGEGELPEALSSDDLNFDQQTISSCGLDDLRQVLLSWAKFTN